MTEGSRGEGSQKEEIMAFEHISVLLYETVDGLNVKSTGQSGEINRNRSGRRCNQGSGKTSGMLRGERHDSQEQLLRYEAAAPETGH